MTRLTKDTKADILQNVMRHAFADEYEALMEERAKLADAIYHGTYSDSEQKLISKCPSGWLNTSSYIFADFGERATSFSFTGKENLSISYHADDGLEFQAQWMGVKKKSEDRKVPGNSWGNCKEFKRGKIRNMYDDIYAKEQTLFERFTTALSEARATIDSATTAKKLVTMWPEIEPFIPASAYPKKNEIAIVSSNLNNKLNLPKEEAA